MLLNKKRLVELTKEIIVFTKEKYQKLNEDQKLTNMVGKIEKLNNLGDEYEELKQKNNILALKLKTVKEIEDDYLSDIRKIQTLSDKNSVREKLELKNKIEMIREEISDYEEKQMKVRAEIENIHKQYTKIYLELTKLAKNKTNEEILEKNKVRLQKDKGSFQERFESAKNNLLKEMIDIINRTENKIGRDDTYIYKIDSIVEGKFIIDEDEEFLISISSKFDVYNIKIAKLINGEPHLIGRGARLSNIVWNKASDGTEYGNEMIIRFYEQLLEFKKYVQIQDEIFGDIPKPKHAYLIS